MGKIRPKSTVILDISLEKDSTIVRKAGSLLYFPTSRSQLRAATAIKRQLPLIVSFLCNWCSYGAADLAGRSRIPGLFGVMCASMRHCKLCPGGLAAGYGVLIAECRLGERHYVKGNYQALQRAHVLKGILEGVGPNPSRVKVVWCAASEGMYWRQR